MTSSARKINNNNYKGFDKDLSISPIRKLTKPKSLSSKYIKIRKIKKKSKNTFILNSNN